MGDRVNVGMWEGLDVHVEGWVGRVCVCVEGCIWGEFLKLNVFVCSNLNNSQPSYIRLTR